MSQNIPPILTYFTDLNFLFAINYACLSNQNQQEPLFSNQDKIIKNEVFNKKSFLTGMLEAEMKDLATKRNNLFDTYLSQIEVFDENAVEDSFLTVKNDLINALNNYYYKDAKFEECFDCLHIIDPEFARDYKKYRQDMRSFENDYGFDNLATSYLQYYSFFQNYLIFRTAKEIYTQLESDLKRNGYQSMMFGKTEHTNLKTATGDSLKDALDFAEKKFKSIQKEIDTLEKSLKKSKNLEEKNDIGFKLSALYIKKSDATELCGFLQRLNERYLCSGGANDSLKNQIKGSKLMATKFFEPNSLKLGVTYIHNLEEKYMNFLFEILETGYKFDPNKTFENKSLLDKLF